MSTSLLAFMFAVKKPIFASGGFLVILVVGFKPLRNI
jgi:hypothetical protein